MPRGVFDPEDLLDAADAVGRAGERMDVGALLGSESATVDPRELSGALRWAYEPVRLELQGSGPVIVSWGPFRFSLEASRG